MIFKRIARKHFLAPRPFFLSPQLFFGFMCGAMIIRRGAMKKYTEKDVIFSVFSWGHTSLSDLCGAYSRRAGVALEVDEIVPGMFSI